jgi:uncharacterized 2Fe-2S/4Fe-4S cluster protein (DUF4445 family)
VQINSSLLDTSLWVFAPDTSSAYQGSTRASPTIEFTNALTANDIINISGTFNFLLDEVQAVILSGADAIFKTDVLVRSFVGLPVTVGCTVKVIKSGVDLSTLLSDLNQVVTAYIENSPIPASLDFVSLESFIRSKIDNVSSINIYEFRRTLTSISTIETISPLKNQEPLFDVASSSLVVSY